MSLLAAHEQGWSWRGKSLEVRDLKRSVTDLKSNLVFKSMIDHPPRCTNSTIVNSKQLSNK